MTQSRDIKCALCRPRPGTSQDDLYLEICIDPATKSLTHLLLNVWLVFKPEFKAKPLRTKPSSAQKSTLICIFAFYFEATSQTCQAARWSARQASRCRYFPHHRQYSALQFHLLVRLPSLLQSFTFVPLHSVILLSLSLSPLVSPRIFGYQAPPRATAGPLSTRCSSIDLADIYQEMQVYQHSLIPSVGKCPTLQSRLLLGS